jgi:4-amino-4-deoxy-L-arabinose transferase-like glycosyltransferase
MALVFWLPLGIDESYYLLYARYFDWHYYDHPFLIGAVLKIFTKSMQLRHPFFYHLPFVLASVASTLLVYKLGSFLLNRRAGWYAILLYTASLYMSIIAGFFVMPDGLMLLFWIIALYLAARYFMDDQLHDGVKGELLIWFGLAVGLAMASKLHAALLWVGFGAYALFFQRKTFFTIYFWVAAILSIIPMLPMIWWNAQNNWVHFVFYSSRVGTDSGFHPEFFFREIAGEFFYQNPIVWISIIIFGFILSRRSRLRKQKIFLLCFSAPLLLMIWFIALFRETLPHWTGPSYVSLIVLASMGLSVREFNRPRIINWAGVALSFLLIIIVSGLALINLYPGTIGGKKSARGYGRNDFTLDMFGWKHSGKALALKLKALHIDSLPIYADNWFPAAHLDEYLTPHTGNIVYGVSDITRIHQYHWINAQRGGLPDRDSAIYIAVSNYPSNPEKLYGQKFKQIQCIDSLMQLRSGKPSRYFHVFLMHERK